MIEKFTVSRDDDIYEAWPDVALTASGKLVCVFSECTHHGDRSYTRVMLTGSVDRGRTWSPKRALTEATHGMPYWNCARITQLVDGRLVVVVDKCHARERDATAEQQENYHFFSDDEGATWGEPVLTPAQGIVPDKLTELDTGRWVQSCHYKEPESGKLVERLWYSDDAGGHWEGPVTVAREPGLDLCEASLLPLGAGVLVAFLREDSRRGLPCYKTISRDNGESWSDPIPFPLPGCHRPVAGFLRDGRILITHRFLPGGARGWGWWTQNLFAGLTDRESALAPDYQGAHTRILPIDFDRSPKSDTGYSGWVQFADDEIYIVNYLLDDAPKGQIRGYALRPEAFVLDG